MLARLHHESICRQQDLNLRPWPYEDPALPLSYAGEDYVAGSRIARLSRGYGSRLQRDTTPPPHLILTSITITCCGEPNCTSVSRLWASQGTTPPSRDELKVIHYEFMGPACSGILLLHPAMYSLSLFLLFSDFKYFSSFIASTLVRCSFLYNTIHGLYLFAQEFRPSLCCLNLISKLLVCPM